ncbi:Outer arm dynein light chain 1 protein [Rhynchospora pubera]|uniref:Outer arm dynein light chain 1 protein n=1 Tax=Rhynchospora pubera TaxID=906938 RepID=A0AAV8CSK3_9POAL|nr:Outer arm dynein light chain 1 protein [Rhynchospora pubera]
METQVERKLSSDRAQLLTGPRGSSIAKSSATPMASQSTAGKMKDNTSPSRNLARPRSSSAGSKSNLSSNSTLPRKRANNGNGTSASASIENPILKNEALETGEKEATLANASSSSQSKLKKKTLPPPVSRSTLVSPALSTPTSSKKPSVKPASSLSSQKGSASSTSSRDGSSRSSTAGSTSTGLRRVSSTMSTASSTTSVKTSLMKMALKRVESETGSVTGKKKSASSDARDLRTLMLPKVENTSDDLRLDRRGHRVCSLRQLSLSPNLEFVYLRDNRLSSVEGIEALKRVKVLDLSFNEFKASVFEPLGNCKGLQQLYLAGNQITSLASLPELPNLEFLSVAQNKLRSLAMASQPRLQVLAASKNKISTLKGFPHLPSLEHLRMEENPILDIPHVEAVSILLVGPTLKKFNDRDLVPSEVEAAKMYPPHTALCVRNGWPLCRPEASAESTFSFLTEQWKARVPPGYTVGEASVDQPFEEDTCTCHFTFNHVNGENYDLALKYQWYLGERTAVNFSPIDGATDKVYWPKREEVGRFLKVECIPTSNGTEFGPIFAISKAICPGTGIPKVVGLTIDGELVEGNVLRGSAKVAWCGGTPGKGVSRWLRRRWKSPEIIEGAEEEEYKLTLDDVSSSLVYMYTPRTQEGTKGEGKHFFTDIVEAAAPSVSNLQIIGDITEGSTLVGTGTYFGGKEGPSKYEWLREKENGEFGLVSSGTTEYSLTKQDIGSRLKFMYTPVNLEVQEGKPGHAVTETVKKAPPKVINLKIVGEMMEGSKVTATSTITGGTEGSSRVQWFKSTSSKFEDENALEALTTSKVVKTFRVPLAAVGFYIVAKLTPMAPDGEIGEPAYIVSESIVATLPPSLNFLTVTGELSEGELLTASYGYIGGHEGKSQYCWYLHEHDGDDGKLLQEATGLLHYRITKDAIGKYISFECTPVRDDGTIGEPKVHRSTDPVRPGSPRLLSLDIVGEPVEETTLIANKMYWGGEEGNSIFRWLLIDSDGIQTEVEGVTSASYTLALGDIGSFVSVSCEPVRSDGACGPVVISEHLGPILPGPPMCRSLELVGALIEGSRLSFVAWYMGGLRGSCIQEWFRVNSAGAKEKLTESEFLDLTLDCVGSQIELVFTPVRNDSAKGSPKRVISDVIIPGEPRGIQLIIPDCHEDVEIVPMKKYFGGNEGTGKYSWYRIREKPSEQDLISLTSSSDALLVSETLAYKPSLEDVGFYLALKWVPIRDDGAVGGALVAISTNPVVPAFPVVSSVCLKEVDVGVYTGEGVYYGGYEGTSLYSWHKETNDGTLIRIDNADSTTYEVTDSDYTCRLLFGYTPVRSDGVVGDLVLSEPSDILYPELLQIDSLSFKGKAIEGDMLTAVEIIPDNESQRNVWNKYKREITYQWYYSISMDETQSFEVLAHAHNSRWYKLRYEDIGRCIKCECTVNDAFGRSSIPASATTSPVLPGIPRIDKLEIEGRGFHTNLYAVKGVYTGGKEGKSRIQWLRSMVGSPDLISIPGEVGRMYEANVDDVGYRLVAIYTPVREDGVEGQPVSVSTEPISVEPDILKEVKQKLELGSAKFEVLRDKDRSERRAPGVANLEKRILELSKKRMKVVKPGSKASFPTTEARGSYAPPFHVELYRNDQHRFKIVVDTDTEVELMVQTRHMRDLIVLVLRGLAQKFNSTSLNSLLKIES